jgi:hypothetical protein
MRFVILPHMEWDRSTILLNIFREAAANKWVVPAVFGYQVQLFQEQGVLNV